ncbi:MAG: FtsX-like permease family protein [Candidatus Aenigmarchaeota archaeon]|nr:FtsX-like permease family protein [Candidatus Aenigmarchaeota archaeon]
MLDMALRNVFRQKARTALTVLGVMIGIAAVVALGSLSEGLRVQITKNLEQASGIVTVTEKSDQGLFVGMTSSELSQETVDEIMSIDGVRDATPVVYEVGYLDDESLGFGQPTLFESGVNPEDIELFTTEGAILDEGEVLEEGDTDYAMIGYTISEDLDLEVGDIVTVEERDFIIKGVYEEFGDPGLDSGIIIPIEIAQELFERDTYSAVIIYPEDLDEVETLANDIEDSIDGVSAFTTAEFAKQIQGIVDQIGFFTIGIAAISAIVGGLGVMNTMIMSVMERRREIGVLKAIGATNSYVLRMILIESAIISLIGGLIGLGIGYLGSNALSFLTGGQAEGIVTIRLAVYSLVFALFLGIVGGLYPANRASKLSPVEALKYE